MSRFSLSHREVLRALEENLIGRNQTPVTSIGKHRITIARHSFEDRGFYGVFALLEFNADTARQFWNDLVHFEPL